MVNPRRVPVSIRAAIPSRTKLTRKVSIKFMKTITNRSRNVPIRFGTSAAVRLALLSGIGSRRKKNCGRGGIPSAPENPHKPVQYKFDAVDVRGAGSPRDSELLFGL